MARGDEPARNMTIREAFAMEAMGGFLSDSEYGLGCGQIMEAACHYADALLAELERTTKSEAGDG